MTKSQELAKKEFEARSRFDAIHKMASPSDAEMKEATELVASIKTLSEQRVAAQQTEKSIADNEAAMKELKEAPTSSMIFAGSDGQKMTAGFVEDGATGLERRGEGAKGAPDLSVVYEEGGLGLSEKQMAAISTKEYKGAFRHYLRAKHDSEMTASEMKTLNEGTDSAGGFLVPDDIQSRVIQKAPTPTRVAGMVTRLQTSRDAMVFPKVNYGTDDIYTTGIRVSWTGELPTSATAHRVTDPQFAQIRIPIHTAMLSMPVTNDMVEDSSFPIVQWSADKFRETIDLLYDNVIINGSGIGQPAGMLLNPGAADQPAVVVSGSAAAVTADGLFDLTYAVPEQYEDNLSFIFNKTQTGKMIGKLKDDNKRYLFARGITDDGLSMGRPTSLLGYPFAYSAFMPNPGANTFPIVFGDPRGYYFVERIGFSIQVLREILAQTNQVLLLGRLRIGGQVAEDWRLKAQKCSV